MFAFVKKLFGKSEPPPSRPEPTSYRATTPFPPKPPQARAATAPPPAPAPVATAVSPKPPAAKAAPDTSFAVPKKVGPLMPESEYSKETVDLPLKPIWGKLNAELVQAAVHQPNSDTILKLPLNLVQAHLARGGMKLSFHEFRQFSPEGLFNGHVPPDGLEITLPISELLKRLKPEQLARRPDQKKVEVPDDIEPIFGTKAAKQGLVRLATEKPKPAPTPTAPVAPAPVAKAPAAEPSAPTPPPAPPVAVAPIVAPSPAPIASEPLRAPNLDPALATLRPTPPVPKPVPPPPPPKAAAHDHVLTINLMDVTAHWANIGKSKLEKLYQHSIEIPVSTVEAALKRGKVEFPWREVRPWLRLNGGVALPTIDDEAILDFPLSFIAPRFFELQQKSAPRKKVEVSEEIPDVFVRHGSAPAPVHAEQATTTASPAEPAATEEEHQPRDFGEIFGQPDKKDWSLGEVSQRTSTLPGVAGAIIATSDGLLVGGEWPGAQSETVAAFVPQIYNRMTGYTKELQLGEPNHFTLLIENVPLQIFKSADSYFTVLGRAGEKLPAKELNAIATRLAETLTAN